jgi:iron(III) transport system substrate-binding protein
MTARSTTLGALAATALAALALATGASAQTGWQAEWDKTLAAAKKEGEVVVAASPNPGRRNWTVAEWAKEFPDIKLSIVMVRGGEYETRVKQERAAGKYLWDVHSSGPSAVYDFIAQGYMEPLVPELILPEVKDPAPWGGWANAFYDKERKYVLAVYRDLEPIWYNAKLAPPEKVARMGARILLAPEYKGKILWQDPRLAGGGPNFAVMLYKVLGEADFRKLMVDQAPVFFTGGNQIVDAMVREKGVFFMGPILTDRLEPYEKTGMKFDMRAMGNARDVAWIGTDGVTLALFKNRPNPNAARVFVNWMMTRKMSLGLAQAQRMDSRRSDIANVSGRHITPGVDYIEPQREEVQADYRKVIALIRELRP